MSKVRIKEETYQLALSVGYNYGNRVFYSPEQLTILDWLRENHNIYIEFHIDKTTDPKFCYQIWKYEDFGNWEEIPVNVFGLTIDYNKNIEDAIIDALNYLKNK